MSLSNQPSHRPLPASGRNLPSVIFTFFCLPPACPALPQRDCRSPTPAHTQTLPERVYAMDVNYPLAVVGTADRNIHVYNLTNPQTPFKIMPSPLKFQVLGQGAGGC